jgi:hypothetical protein
MLCVIRLNLDLRPDRNPACVAGRLVDDYFIYKNLWLGNSLWMDTLRFYRNNKG